MYRQLAITGMHRQCGNVGNLLAIGECRQCMYVGNSAIGESGMTEFIKGIRECYEL